ncbi:hypothetical protein THAOC_02966, partial [Thalassiosira oceanica]
EKEPRATAGRGMASRASPDDDDEWDQDGTRRDRRAARTEGARRGGHGTPLRAASQATDLTPSSPDDAVLFWGGKRLPVPRPPGQGILPWKREDGTRAAAGGRVSPEDEDGQGFPEARGTARSARPSSAETARRVVTAPDGSRALNGAGSSPLPPSTGRGPAQGKAGDDTNGQPVDPTMRVQARGHPEPELREGALLRRSFVSRSCSHISTMCREASSALDGASQTARVRIRLEDGGRAFPGRWGQRGPRLPPPRGPGGRRKPSPPRPGQKGEDGRTRAAVEETKATAGGRVSSEDEVGRFPGARGTVRSARPSSSPSGGRDLARRGSPVRTSGGARSSRRDGPCGGSSSLSPFSSGGWQREGSPRGGGGHTVAHTSSPARRGGRLHGKSWRSARTGGRTLELAPRTRGRIRQSTEGRGQGQGREVDR